MAASILDEIFAYKRLEVAERQAVRPLARVIAQAEQAAPPRDFVAALRRGSSPAAPALIAEIKFASPSRGRLLADQDPAALAELYRANGASAISILTDERYFQGSLAYLQSVASLEPRLPLLRKEFVCSPYQVYEARAAGADAVLLIAAMLAPSELASLHALILALGMTPLVEVHTLDELQAALECSPLLVGINNRDLHTFQVSLETTLRLRPRVPPQVCLVAESGIQTPADVSILAEAGVDAMLIGEALVTAPDIAIKIQELLTPDPSLLTNHYSSERPCISKSAA